MTHNIENEIREVSTFSELGLDQGIVDALAKRSIIKPFEIQTLSIPAALDGHDICGKAKTGAGKTFAFGLPVLHLLKRDSRPQRGNPLALALVPTRELATQVCGELEEVCHSLGLGICAIYGGTDIDKQIKELDGSVDLIIATPGRLIDLIERDELSLAAIKYVIVDEADRMADMGFMPQVEWILRHVKGEHQTLLFSATLDGAVDGLISRYQKNPKRVEVESENQTVDSMAHRFLAVHEMDRAKVVAAIAKNYGKTLVFSRTKHGADRLARELNNLDVQAAAIHGDLRQRSRENALAKFSSGQLDALIATNVAARGIHVDEVEVVVHYQPAANHTTYLHRSGRTARAGASGIAVTLSLWDQELEVKRLQQRLGLDIPIVEMFSNDERLKDLASWDPHSAQ